MKLNPGNSAKGIFFILIFAVGDAMFSGCSDKKEADTTEADKTEGAQSARLPITGTWKLLSGTLIEKNDTTVTYYKDVVSFIKIINEDHFSFLSHDLHQGKDSTASFGAGGGKYSLNGDTYIEHLEYCSDRQWEGNDFTFTITIQNDTLIQKGVEKVESAGIDRMNIEKYVRLNTQ